MKSDPLSQPNQDSLNQVLQRALKELFPEELIQKPSDSVPFWSTLANRKAEHGLSFGVFEAAVRLWGVTRQDAATLLRIPPRTLARRKTQRLTPKESDRLIRVLFMWGEASGVLGTSKKAWRWMRKPNPVLGGVTPLSLVDSTSGREAVKDALGWIEYGVFS